MSWTVETLNEVVENELLSLPVDMRARFVRIAQLIESVGLENVREPHVKHIDDILWEIRMKGKMVSLERYMFSASKTGCRCTSFCEKNTKNTTERNQVNIK